MSPTPQPAPNAAGEFLLFQTENAQTRVQVRLTDGGLWLTQRQMAELFEKDVRTANEHLKNVYADGELDPDATIRKFRIVAREGARDIEILTHAGRMTAEAAQGKAEAAFEVYRQQQLALPSRTDQDFLASLDKPVKALLAQRKVQATTKNKKGAP